MERLPTRRRNEQIRVIIKKTAFRRVPVRLEIGEVEKFRALRACRYTYYRNNSGVRRNILKIHGNLYANKNQSRSRRGGKTVRADVNGLFRVDYRLYNYGNNPALPFSV